MKIIKVTVFLVLFYLPVLFAGQTQGIWVVRDALTSKSVLKSIIQNAQLLNCNKIFLQFRALGSVYYPTKLDIPQIDVDAKLLKNLFEAAHQNNIEVHAWLNVCYVWSNKDPRIPANHILNKSKNAIITPIDSLMEPEGYFLHPNDKSNLSEVKSIIKELADLYKIDGIHLDYFRYPKESHHTSRTGRTEFKIINGIDPLDPLKDPEKFIKARNIESFEYLQKSYRDFLRDELTEALKEIHNFIDENNLNLQLSVAVKPNPIAAKHHFLQDWSSWLDSSLCDFVVLMNYNPELSKFVKNLEITKENTDISKIMVGIAAYNISEEEVVKRINLVKNSSYGGYALFSYNYISSQQKLFKQLKLAVK